VFCYNKDFNLNPFQWISGALLNSNLSIRASQGLHLHTYSSSSQNLCHQRVTQTTESQKTQLNLRQQGQISQISMTNLPPTHFQTLLNSQRKSFVPSFGNSFQKANHHADFLFDEQKGAFRPCCELI